MEAHIEFYENRYLFGNKKGIDVISQTITSLHDCPPNRNNPDKIFPAALQFLIIRSLHNTRMDRTITEFCCYGNSKLIMLELLAVVLLLYNERIQNNLSLQYGMRDNNIQLLWNQLCSRFVRVCVIRISFQLEKTRQPRCWSPLPTSRFLISAT